MEYCHHIRGDQRGARLEQRELGEGDAEAEEEPEEQSEAEDTNLSRRSIDKADSKGKVTPEPKRRGEVVR